MNLLDLLTSLRRRWYLALVAMLIVSTTCWMAAAAIPASYDAEASVVLVPPKSQEDPTSNRYLALGGLNQAVSVLIRSVTSDDVRDALQAEAPGTAFVVEPDPTTSAPIILISVNGVSADKASKALDRVLSEVTLRLNALQDELEIGPQARINSIQVTHDEHPTVNTRARMRIVAALWVLLVGASILTIGALDGVLLRRRRRASALADDLEPVRPMPGPGQRSPTTMVVADQSDPTAPGSDTKKSRESPQLVVRR